MVCSLLVLAASPQTNAEHNVFVFSEFITAPLNPTAPFAFAGTQGVQLTLDGNARAVGIDDVVAPLFVNVESPLIAQGHRGPVDRKEGEKQRSPGMIARLNSELATLDAVDSADDPAKYIDFAGHAAVQFAQLDSPTHSVLVVENGGLDPFRLIWSDNVDFKSPVVLFEGWTKQTRDALLARPDFGADDSGPDVDQAWLFEFTTPLAPGFLRLRGDGRIGDTRLQVDFAGTAAMPIPEPSAWLLVTGALTLLSLLGRRGYRER